MTTSETEKKTYNFLEFVNSLEPPKQVQKFIEKEPIIVQPLVLEPTSNRYTTQFSCKDYKDISVPPVWMRAANLFLTTKENWVSNFSFEIRSFVNFMKATQSEMKKRDLVFKRYKELIEKVYSDRDVRVYRFGSVAMEMFLPTADLDIVVIDPEFDKEESPEQGKMASKLSKIMKKVYSMASLCRLIRRAKVPVLNMVDKDTGIHIDITFNNKSSSVNVVDAALAFKSQLPHLESLVYVLKLFLDVRGLNKPANGGIGGYAIILWVAGFLRMHDLLYNKEIPDPTEKPAYVDLSRITTESFQCPSNVALFFMHFLHFFGYCFDFENVGIAPGGIPGSPDIIFFQRKLFSEMHSRNRDSICLMDPMKSGNNVAGGCSKTQVIAEHFRAAYITLGEAINRSKPNQQNWFLAFVLKFDSDLGKQRLAAYKSKRISTIPPKGKEKPAASASVAKKENRRKRSRSMVDDDYYSSRISDSRSSETYRPISRFDYDLVGNRSPLYEESISRHYSRSYDSNDYYPE